MTSYSINRYSWRMCTNLCGSRRLGECEFPQHYWQFSPFNCSWLPLLWTSNFDLWHPIPSIDIVEECEPICVVPGDLVSVISLNTIGHPHHSIVLGFIAMNFKIWRLTRERKKLKGTRNSEQFARRFPQQCWVFNIFFIIIFMNDKYARKLKRSMISMFVKFYNDWGNMIQQRFTWF